jgi:hypothetical protein
MKGREEDGGLTVEKNLSTGLQTASISIQFWQCWAKLWKLESLEGKVFLK